MVKKEKIEVEINQKNIKYLEKLIKQGKFLSLDDAVNTCVYACILIEKQDKKRVRVKKKSKEEIEYLGGDIHKLSFTLHMGVLCYKNV